MLNNIFKFFSNCSIYPVTDDNYFSYSNIDKINNYYNCYNSLQNLSNIFYLTPGWNDDPNAGTLLALTSCGETNGRTDKNRDCVMFRDYKRPISDRWFTDYIYQADYSYEAKNLSSDNVPFKPYHPYSIIVDRSSDIPQYHSNPDNNNAEAVLNSLNQSTSDISYNTEWVRCSELVDKIDIKTEKLTFGTYEEGIDPNTGKT